MRVARGLPTFRLDRIEVFRVTDQRFRPEPGRTLHDFLKRTNTWTRSALGSGQAND
jgi:predicted DNA-binding transcriptional regulator YafY